MNHAFEENFSIILTSFDLFALWDNIRADELYLHQTKLN